MPLKMYKPTELKKLKKNELLFHALDLQEFINIFDNLNMHLELNKDDIEETILFTRYRKEHYDKLATDNLSFEDWKETL